MLEGLCKTTNNLRFLSTGQDSIWTQVIAWTWTQVKTWTTMQTYILQHTNLYISSVSILID